MLRKILESANMPGRRVELGRHYESNLPGVHVIGDLAGAPVLKLAMEHGRELGEYLAGLAANQDQRFLIFQSILALRRYPADLFVASAETGAQLRAWYEER